MKNSKLKIAKFVQSLRQTFLIRRPKKKKISNRLNFNRWDQPITGQPIAGLSNFFSSPFVFLLNDRLLSNSFHFMTSV